MSREHAIGDDVFVVTVSARYTSNLVPVVVAGRVAERHEITTSAELRMSYVMESGLVLGAGDVFATKRAASVSLARRKRKYLSSQ